MSEMCPTIGRDAIAIGIGGVTVRVRAADRSFLEMLERRYAGFTGTSASADCEFDIELIPAGHVASSASDLRVRRNGPSWELERGDFRAEWNSISRMGRIRQSANPYSLDSVLRIVHTLLLIESGGFLLHAASAIRGGRAFLFAGVSGAGKTTMAKLAPADATLLTDEISYVRHEHDEYCAYGTPFAGELAAVGENVRARLAAVYLLTQGREHRLDDVAPGEALRTLMRNVLFFAGDAALVQRVFLAVCAFIGRVPVRRLTFLPDARVWRLIQ